MSDIPPLVLALLVGFLLGTFFFGGLWWTVRKGLTSDQPAAWFLGSLLLRTLLIVAGFYWVAQGHWSGLLACLAGFLIARVVIVRRLTRTPIESPSEEEAGVAPQSR